MKTETQRGHTTNKLEPGQELRLLTPVLLSPSAFPGDNNFKTDKCTIILSFRYKKDNEFTISESS